MWIQTRSPVAEHGRGVGGADSDAGVGGRLHRGAVRHAVGLACAIEGRAEVVLQRLDLTAERGLGNVQPLGRTRNALCLGDGHEVLQLTLLHATILIVNPDEGHRNHSLSTNTWQRQSWRDIRS